VLKCWTICVFEPPFGGLGATYTVHLRLIGKLVVDFLFVLGLT